MGETFHVLVNDLHGVLGDWWYTSSTILIIIVLALAAATVFSLKRSI
jgi:hypothetical protein